MKTWIIHLAEKIRAAAWTKPTAYVLLALALSEYTLWLDLTEAGRVFESSGIFKLTSPEGVRALLGTIATSMLTITGVSFSSIMVVMTLASQQFGPRLLRNFLKDRASQRTLGMLMGTFVFCLSVMKDVKSGGSTEFVPHLSTFTGLVLALVALGYFIYFIQHILNEIQAEHVVADAYEGLAKNIEAVFRPSEKNPDDDPAEYQDGDSWEITAGRTGYVQAINFEELLPLAQKHDLVLEVRCRAGDFVSPGQTVIKVRNGPHDLESDAPFIRNVRKALFVGSRRTPEQDFEYGFRQLVEVALRALSPSLNDPFTAMDCIDYLGAGLQSAFSRTLPKSVRRDSENKVRVVNELTTYRGLVEAAVNQIRQAARGQCDVSCRLLEMLAKTAAGSEKKDQQEAILHQATLIQESALPEGENSFDRKAIDRRFDEVVEACNLVDSSGKNGKAKTRDH